MDQVIPLVKENVLGQLMIFAVFLKMGKTNDRIY